MIYICDKVGGVTQNGESKYKIQKEMVTAKPSDYQSGFGYNVNVLQQTACLVVNPTTVGNFAFLFNCTPVGRTSDSMMVRT